MGRRFEETRSGRTGNVGAIEPDLYGDLLIADYSGGLVMSLEARASDEDGVALPDWWERRHGLSPASADGDDGAMGDPDGDEESNLREYEGGGHPRSVAIADAVVEAGAPMLTLVAIESAAGARAMAVAQVECGGGRRVSMCRSPCRPRARPSSTPGLSRTRRRLTGA